MGLIATKLFILLFIIAKLGLYTLWCWYGIRLLAPSRRNATAVAFGLACVRLVVGLALGMTWAYLISFLAPSAEYNRLGFDPFTFMVGLLGLRLLLWSAMSVLIRIGTGRLYLLGAGIADWLWRLGGVGLSFIGDALGLVGWVGVVGIIC
jgi:hypothetical protein